MAGEADGVGSAKRIQGCGRSASRSEGARWADPGGIGEASAEAAVLCVQL